MFARHRLSRRAQLVRWCCPWLARPRLDADGRNSRRSPPPSPAVPQCWRKFRQISPMLGARAGTPLAYPSSCTSVAGSRPSGADARSVREGSCRCAWVVSEGLKRKRLVRTGARSPCAPRIGGNGGLRNAERQWAPYGRGFHSHRGRGLAPIHAFPHSHHRLASVSPVRQLPFAYASISRLRPMVLSSQCGDELGRADSTAQQTSERNRKSAVRPASSAGSRRIGNGQRGKHDPLACKVHVRQARAVAAGGSGTAIAVAGRRCGVRALTGAIARFVRRITLICSRHRLRLRLQSAFVQSKLLFYRRKDAETLVDGAG